MTTSDVAIINTIDIRGSTADGIGLEGAEDRDEMCVFVEPATNVCGFASVDHHAPAGVRSGPGDLVCTRGQYLLLQRIADSRRTFGRVRDVPISALRRTSGECLGYPRSQTLGGHSGTSG
jgi:hypothetical protein